MRRGPAVGPRRGAGPGRPARAAPAREVLDVAALIGTRIEPRLVAAVDGRLGGGHGRAARRPALLAEDGTWLRFRHEIARLAVEQALPGAPAGRHPRPDPGALRSARLRRRRPPGVSRRGGGRRPGRAALRARRRAAGRGPGLASRGGRAVRAGAAVRGRRSDAAARRAVRRARRRGVADRPLARKPPTPASGRSGCGGRRVTGCARATRMRRLSRTMWRLCRGEEAAAAAETALAILRAAGAERGAGLGLRQRRQPADAGRRARHGARAGPQALRRPPSRPGVPEVLSDALNTEGCCARGLGRGDWAGPLNQALRIAVSASLDEQAGRAFANLHAIYCAERRFAEADRCFAEGVAYCDEHDISTYRGLPARASGPAPWRRPATGTRRSR